MKNKYKPITQFLALMLLFSVNLFAQDYAVNFNGSGQYGQVAHNNALKPSQFTYEAWAYPTNTNSGYHTIFSAAELYSGSAYGVVMYLNGTQWEFWYAGNSFQWGKKISIGAQAGKWTHLACTYDGANFRFYVDGVQAGSTSSSDYHPDINGYPFYIGADYSSTGYYFNGKIDRVRIWNAALTPQQLKQNALRVLSPTEPNLVANYEMDEGPGNNSFGNSCTNYGSGSLSGSLINFTVYDYHTWNDAPRNNMHLKADAGLTQSGNNVTAWTDQTSTNNFTVHGTLGYVANAVNFNPAVSFSNSDATNVLPTNRLQSDANIKVVGAMAVFKTNADNVSGSVIGSSVAGSSWGKGFFLGFGNDKFYVSEGIGNQYYTNSSSGTFHVAYFDTAPVNSPYNSAVINGAGQIITSNSGSDYESLTLNTIIGGTLNPNTSGFTHFNGQLAEVILYTDQFLNLYILESYLAVKYGIHLSTNYVNSANSVIWNATTNSTYHHDVFGIGRDDANGLNQSISNSVNTGSGDGTGQSGKGNIVLSNANSLGDGDFLLIGNDNASLSYSSTELPGDMSDYYRTAREWLVDKTNDVGTITLKFDMTGLPGISVGGAATDYELLIDADGDFTSGATRVVASALEGNVAVFNNLSFADLDKITFAAKISALPVELTSFTANLADNKVLLNWQTATEVNNYGFEIERSAVGTSRDLSLQWAKVGFIEGNGNSNSPKEYSFLDATAQNGTYTYRLKQIDFDGKFEYSNVVEVNTLPTEYSLEQNYPNPFNPSTTIKYSIPTVETGHAPSLQTNVVLKVYDILGNEVATLVNEKQEAGNYEVSFDASGLTSGVYVYRLNAGSFVSVKKMMMLK